MVAFVLGGAGCTSDGHFTAFGYTTQPNYDPTIRTVYVPIATNASYRRDLGYDLTQAVIRELSAKSAIRVTSDKNTADTELVMKIVTRKKALILPNPINEIRDQDVQIQVEVVWRDLRLGHVGDVLSNNKRFDPNEKPLPGQSPDVAPKAIPVLITPTGSYQPELGGSTTTAEQTAINRAAVQIIQMMEKGW